MTQPLKNSSNPRRVPSRSALESVRPATAQAARTSETAGLEPPVLLKLADFSHLAGRRGSRRGAVKLPPIPTTLPVPVVALPADEQSDDMLRDEIEQDASAELRDQQPAALAATPLPTPRGRHADAAPSVPVSREPLGAVTSLDDLPPPPKRDEPELRLHEEKPLESPRETSPAAEVKTRSLPPKKEAAAAESPPVASSEPLGSSSVEASVASDVAGEVATPRETSTAASRRARPAAVVAGKSAPVAADTTAPTPAADSDEDSPSFWDRVGSFRPSIPVLLALVLVTIGVAYVYRPQETPPKRRGSLERAEPKRLFGSEFDEQRPKPLTTGDSRTTTAAAEQIAAERPTTGRGADLKLDMPTNAPERAATKSDASLPSSNGANRDSAAGSADPASRLATRPAPTEHFDSSPPPPMPVEAPLESNDAATAADEEDDGPPPDITGRSYPVTSPSNFFYRPQAVEAPTPDLREASRPTSGGPR